MSKKVAQNARGGMWVIWAMLKRKSVFFWGFSLKKYQDVMQNCTKKPFNDIPNLKSKSKGLEIDLKCLRRRQLFHPNMVTPASKDLSTERKKESRHPAMLYHRKMASMENLLSFKISTYNPSKIQVRHFIKLKDERSEFSRILFEIESF